MQVVCVLGAPKAGPAKGTAEFSTGGDSPATGPEKETCHQHQGLNLNHLPGGGDGNSAETCLVVL